MNKRIILSKLIDFFERENDGIAMTQSEYSAYPISKVPIRAYRVKRYWGAWVNIQRAANKKMGLGVDDFKVTQTDTIVPPSEQDITSSVET